jgi:hypothetical protein
MAVRRDFLWFRGFGRSRVGDSAMAYRRKFPEQRAYERRLAEQRLAEDGTLRRRAWGLVVIGVGCLLTGMATGDAFAVTVGVISGAAGGTWRLWLGIPDP